MVEIHCYLCDANGCYTGGCAISRPTERWGEAGDISLGHPNLFQEKGRHEDFKFFFFIFTFLGCIFTLFLFLPLSIALSQ